MNALLDMTLRQLLRTLLCGAAVALSFYLPLIYFLLRAPR